MVVGNAPFTIDSVGEASPGVVRIELTPTGAGTIRLQVNAGAVLKDVIGNALDTSSAILDDTTITVEDDTIHPYESWSGGSALALDENDDGVPNGLAWLLGAASANEDSLQRMPATTQNSGALVLTFRCLKAANRGGTSLKIQYSTDLGATSAWSANEAEVPDTDSTVNGVVFDTTDDGDFINVIATIPASAAAPGNKLFARLAGGMP